MSTAPGSRLLAAVVLSACVGLIGGGLAAWGVYAHFGPVERVVTQNRSGGGAVSIGDIATAVQPAVVTVSTQPAATRALADGFGRGLAEGFVVSGDGLVVTSARAVRGATRLRIATADGHGYDATIAASDPAHGLVVLRAAGATGLQSLRFATQAPRIGDLAVVVSRPALGPLTTRSGVVASVGISADDVGATVGDLLAVDATAASGAEGAPLVDGNSAVIGVLSEIPGAPGVMGASGRDAAALVAAIPNGAQAARGSLGVASVTIGAATAAAAQVPQGALVTAVDPVGPAAGLLTVGDVVTTVNGTPVGTLPLQPAAFGLQVGQQAILQVTGSDGATRSVTLVVAAG